MFHRHTEQEMLEEAFEDNFGHRLPTRKEVCDDCRGEGSNSKHLGAFTADEWYEMGDEFHDGYLRGDYDQICQTCNGLRVIDVEDERALSDEEREYVEGWWRDVAESDAIARQERAMGA